MVRPLRELLVRLRKDSAPIEFGELTDADLLDRFVSLRDEAAFELLVWRHGGMVLSLAMRWLGDTGDAEDAFQATFLTFTRKARSIRRGQSLPAWLHRVACRISWRSARGRARRRRLEQPLSGSEFACPALGPEADLARLLDREVDLLPDRQRRVIIICYLEGRSTSEAAIELGCPRGTVLSRLDAARRSLRLRLTRRGVAPALAAGLTFGTSELAPSAPLVANTMKVCFGAPAASSQVLLMSSGVIQAMFWKKCRVVIALVILAGLCGIGSEVGRADRPVPLDDAAVGKGQPSAEKNATVAINTANEGDGPDDAKTRLSHLQSELDSATILVEEIDRKYTQERLKTRIDAVAAEEKLREMELRHKLQRELEQRTFQKLESAIQDRSARARSAELTIRDIEVEIKQFSESSKTLVDESEKRKAAISIQHAIQLRASRGQEAKECRDEILVLQKELEMQPKKAAVEEDNRTAQRIEMRKDVLAAESRMELLDRTQSRRIAQAMQRFEIASLRVRQANFDPNGPILLPTSQGRELQQKLEQIQREMAELRQEIKRLTNKAK